MRESIQPARDGSPTATAGGLSLHSRFDPSSEARRFASSLPGLREATAIVVVAPCLGYLLSALRDAAPGRPVIALQCSDFFGGDVMVARPDALWTPGSALGVEAFLDSVLDDRSAAAVRTVAWKPAVEAYGRPAADLVDRVEAYARRAAAGEKTRRSFGRRWFRNAFRRIAGPEVFAAFLPGSCPAVVAAAGPGLEASAEAMRRARGPFFVVAAASAVPALSARGVRVDLAVATDGGAWSRWHLREAARLRIPVAAALVADVPAACGPVALIDDGSAWQAALLSGAGLSASRLPSRGTVAATAVDIALAVTTGPVYVAGLDLACDGERCHARPYAFDELHRDGQTRLRPAAAIAFDRARTAENTGALEVYADWFATRFRSAPYAGRVRALGAVHPKLGYLPRSDALEAEGSADEPRLALFQAESPGPVRAAAAAAALKKAVAEDGRAADEVAALTGLDARSPDFRASAEAAIDSAAARAAGGTANPGRRA